MYDIMGKYKNNDNLISSLKQSVKMRKSG